MSTLVLELVRKVESRTAHVGIIGIGYVGLPLALSFSEHRFVVTGFDIHASNVKTLNAGGSYIVRIAGAEAGAA